MRNCYLPILLLSAALFVFPEKNHAQTNTRSEHQARYVLNISRTAEPVQVDGDLSEAVWKTAHAATDFWLKWPRDGAPAPQQTEVRCAYDDRFLYIAFTAYDTTPQYVIQSLKRDVSYWDSDGVAVVLDPANTANNGYFFGTSPNGVQTEALLSTGNDDMDRNWDNTWFVETRNYPDREAFDGSERLRDQFSRNAGVELGYISTDGQWQGWCSHHRSFQPGVSQKNWWGNMGGQFKNRRFDFLLDMLHMGENYRADLGFERRIENYDVARDTTLRLGYNFVFSNWNYRVFPKKTGGRLNFLEIGGEAFQVINPDGSLNESSNEVNATWNFKNTSEFSIGIRPAWANVPVAFKFDDEDDLTRCPALPAGEYAYTSMGVEWNSDYRKRFFVSLSGGAGGFYNGRQYRAGLEMNWRIRTLANIRLAAEFNQLDFPEPYCDVPLFNLTPRVEVFFAKNLWWTTFLQYNTQADNFNINSRLQWRFRPMSDVFVVYTDNYTVQVWGVRNRALAAKVAWWF